MKTHNRILTVVFVCALILGACAPATEPSLTQTPEPIATVAPAPTLRPEKNVSQNKPVRVSASWVAEPPEKAVNGNPNDWWGAGGPVPQWIEVDLEGIYSISRIRIINEGPTGYAPYQVYGRGPDNVNHLLHVFEGAKSNNQTLDFSPETAWEGISTIRIEINSGSGWVGFREIQVFSRDEPEPLPLLGEAATPLYLAEVDPASLKPITADNAIFMEQLAVIGRGKINDLAWSPEGDLLAAASPLGIWLYDPAALTSPPRLLEGHARDVLSVAFSPDGETILSGSQDGTVKVWDIKTGELKHSIALWADFSHEVGDQKRDPEVWSMAFSPDTKLFATGGFDGTLRLWDLGTGRERDVLKRTGGLVFSLAFSPDGTLLVSSGYDGTLLVWDVATGNQVATLTGHEGWARSLVFSPDGKTLATGSSDTTVRLWDVGTGTVISVLKGHDREVAALTFSPDGETLASNSVDGMIQFWDMETGQKRPSVIRIYGEAIMAFSPDGAKLATSTQYGFLQIWDASTGEPIALVSTHTSPINSIAFSPDNRMIASGGEDGLVRIWDVKKNTLQGVLLGHFNGVTGLMFSPDGKFLASSSFDGTVILWDTASGSQSAVLKGHEGYVRCVAFSPDGKTVASGGTDRTVRLWDISTGRERVAMAGHSGEVESVAFSPDGIWLVSASADYTLRIWEIATGEESGVLQGHQSFALSTAFSPDGNLIASSGGDHWLRMWRWKVVSNAASATNQFTPIGHPGWVLSVAFSPDGRIIASSNVSTTSYMIAPGEIHLYSAETGYPYALLRGHTKRVTSVAFSPDGKLLASGSADGSIRLWGTQQEGFELASQPVIATPNSEPVPVDEDPFVGEWTAADPGDGSNMTLTIARNGDGYNLTLFDDKASVCGKDASGKPKFAIEMTFTGTVYKDTLDTVSTSATCLSSPESPLQGEFRMDISHQADTDTLWDSLNQAQWRRSSSARDDFDGSHTKVWHRLNPNQSNTSPEHEVLTCEWNEDVNCSYFKQAEPALGFEDPPDATTGSFSGQDVTADWVCPNWFPSFICENLKFVASGMMAVNPSDGNKLTARQDLIVTTQGGKQILYVYWTEQDFYCPWYEDFDMALAANPFPTPFNGSDGPLMDCNQAPAE
jgi:WD40 repeat protein